MITVLEPKKIYSYKQFQDIFSDETVCRKYLENIRWGTTPACIHCGTTNVCNFKTDIRMYQCRECRVTYSVTVKTLFQNSKLPLSVWFNLIYSMCINKKNISSAQIARNFGLSQKAAWNMTTKIRCLFSDKEPQKLSGIVEIDECYLTKSGRWGHWGRGIRKTPIIGMKQRGGEVRVFSVDNKKRDLMEALIRDNVEEGSTIYTDGCKSYLRLDNWFEHDSVNHREREYVSADNPSIHTNSIENVWSCLKKSIRGAHHSVSQKHLQKYCDEAAYRINYKHLSPIEKFNDLLSRALVTEQQYFKREAKIIAA